VRVVTTLYYRAERSREYIDGWVRRFIVAQWP